MRPFFLAFLCSMAAAAQQALPDPDVMRIHVLERRPFTEAGRWELSFFGATQVNPKFTTHAGISAELAYHLRENLAVQLGGTFFPLAVQSTLSEELLTKALEAPTTAEAFLVRGAAVAGLELMPIYGKLNVFDGKILRLGMYFNAGLGVAKTRLQLHPSSYPGGRTFGDTGLRPLGSLGMGLRVFVTERFTVRLELRDLAYSGSVSEVNGCTRTDAQAIEAAYLSDQQPTGLSPGCDAAAFGTPGRTGTGHGNAGAAQELLRDPSAEVINNLTFQGGISWLF